MRRSAFLLVVAACLTVAACPDKTGGGAGDGGVGTDGGKSSGGGGTGGTVDVGCTGDDACGVGQICDLSRGDCVAGLDCTGNAGLCAFCDDEGTGCGFVGAGYCDEGAGVCRRTKATCDPCTNDVACGTGQSGLPNRCIDGYCAEGCGACPAGFVCESGGCVPAPNAGSCERAILCRNGEACPDGQRCSDLGVCLSICENDGECPAGKICSLDPGPLLGQCISGCPPGEQIVSGGETQVCHANGRYGDPCPTPGETTGCPPGTECDEGGFCGLAGCASDNDCPLVRTYCDTATGECVEGCNDESDCAAFELCEQGHCVPQGCRGKDVSCNLGEWCCGNEAFADASTCPAGVEEGSCFLAPDPWCRPCESNDDCADIDVLGFSSYCYELQREEENGETVSLGKFCSVGCNSNADCPRGIQCQLALPTDQEGVTTQGCIDAICAPLAEGR